LPNSQLETGAELLFVHTRVDSSLSPGSLGPGIPLVGLAGSTSSDTGAAPLPTVALAYLPEGSPLGFGLGIFALAGFGVNYAGSTNPILTAPPPAGAGFGPVYSNLQVLQIHPAVAYQLTDRLSVGAGPTVNLAMLALDPWVLAPPDNANGNGFPTYPHGTHMSTTWGAGFNVGAYYRADVWGLGVSFKSPQWFDTFRVDSADQLGRPRRLTYGADLPLIVSLGAAYTGLDRWVFAADFRYIDYSDARGLRQSGFNPDGSVQGPGWQSIVAIATGAQYQLTDAISLRAGYTWNQNPVPNSQAFINTEAPVVIEHMISAGLSWRVADALLLSLTYMHGFANSISGPFVTPGGAIPGSSVRNTASLDSVVLGVTVMFGRPRGRAAVHADAVPEAGSQ
jgi:long-chain fatty acid transport protein